jgi:hypothetical protein
MSFIMFRLVSTRMSTITIDPFGMVNTSFLVDGELGEREVVKADIVREGQGVESMNGRMKRGIKL